MKPAVTIHMMTAALALGDAIGNYMATLRQLLTGFGCQVQLYADWISPEFPGPAYTSDYYRATGRDILWYHYSIGADNLTCVTDSADYRLMDFHGVSPARLFAGYDPHLEQRCRVAEESLPQLRDQFDTCVVHSEYSRQVLIEAGYSRVEKLPLVVDTARYAGAEDAVLSRWVSQLDYLLFVGRVVPQKDILSLLHIFAEVRKRRPDSVLIIVGSRQLAPGYQRQIDRAIKQFQLTNRVLFTGQISDVSVLSSLYRRARFTLIVSEWESFCVPAVESMFFGTPVVAHPVPPVPEVMGAGGITIDKRDPQKAAEQIDRLWDDSPRRRQLQEAARARARAFTTEVLQRELLAMFQRVFV